MAGYNVSSAYDLSAFDPVAKKPEAPKLKMVKSHRKIAAAAFSPRVLSAFAIVVTLVGLMVYNQVQLNELSTEINELTKEMQALESENVKMTSALESTISPYSIAEQAAAMGLQVRDEYQTVRIYLYQEDVITRTEDAPKSGAKETAKLAVASLWGRFQEYLAG